MEVIPKIPVAEWVSSFTEWVTDTFEPLFDFIKNDFGDFIEMFAEDWLMSIPIWLFIIVVGAIAFFISGKKLGLTAFSVVGLWFISNQELWEELMNTFTLVIFASLISVIIGVPFGIWMAKSGTVEKILTPILDFMQTMPAFVYLIPAVAFFSIGMVPGVAASVIFATPPTVRFTNLGIRQVSHELIEASDSFGTTNTQKLFKVQLPMAKKTIMAGINQTVMLALSMVVIASMIGAKGLGQTVITGLQRADVGTGFVAGLGIVILAIIIDRFTQNLNTQRGE
ncbi:MAG: proline/glycine betaine ABC transporter permease [Halobacillus sp.]|uniref:ABC-type transport system permease protein (Probable substrate glycine betaine) n=1 Tax=Halobacillus halophilus (strain ATCC 35676 / DSM 2266 / JCM 20832 / KCTC 3685 / LMG 17431 / NBRC 102448 / NCIMB 2269) TaxID=866895 RepID=I0JK92_HALH3|nr:proline/glycine betaine ABC transporter permease [Halobacillus halophilus]ASF38710.1 glycine/betaine ABC transporter [Halobacillus halophilus]CCG44561.1 ABC-type transport system permease protein (probable substrate glycine betaine) [Halobacillus halophilus DSM 2266]